MLVLNVCRSLLLYSIDLLDGFQNHLLLSYLAVVKRNAIAASLSKMLQQFRT